MSLFESCDSLSGIFLANRNVLELAKVYLMVDDRMTSPIPSYAIEVDSNEIIEALGISNLSPDGISLTNMPYLSTVLYWSLKKNANTFYDEVKPFILDTDPCDFIAVSEFYKIPKHGMYFEIEHEGFYGFVVGWDYRLNYAEEQVDILTFCWLSHENQGVVFQIELPRKYELLDLNVFKGAEYYALLEKSIGVLFYVLMQNEESENVVIGGNVYRKYGKELSSKILAQKLDENSFGRAGHWRKGHLHLYWMVINGNRVAVHKWLEPVWVSGSVVKNTAKK